MFFERRDDGAPPAGASDRMIDVGGARLHVRLHAAAGGAGTLLLFHGNGEVVADYDDAAEQFARAGVALAVVDYRGYGRSEGTSTLRTVISDARVVAEAIQPRVVMGRSLGGVAAHELYARPTQGLAGVILESALFDLGALVRRRGLEPPRTFSAEERATFEPAGKLGRGRLPLLVLHGEHDDLIVLDEARAAHASAGAAEADRSLVVVPGRGHNDVSLGEGYWTAIADFLARLPVSPDGIRGSDA